MQIIFLEVMDQGKQGRKNDEKQDKIEEANERDNKVQAVPVWRGAVEAVDERRGTADERAKRTEEI